MKLTERDLKKIDYVLDWYAGTDGSEQDQASDAMYRVLTCIYNKAVKELKPAKKVKP